MPDFVSFSPVFTRKNTFNLIMENHGYNTRWKRAVFTLSISLDSFIAVFFLYLNHWCILSANFGTEKIVVWFCSFFWQNTDSVLIFLQQILVTIRPPRRGHPDLDQSRVPPGQHGHHREREVLLRTLPLWPHLHGKGNDFPYICASHIGVSIFIFYPRKSSTFLKWISARIWHGLSQNRWSTIATSPQ